MKPHILISGGTGLIGSHLAQLLAYQGYKISFLSRQYRSMTGIDVIRWDPEKQWIDNLEIDGPIAIINLAGENLSSKSWTKEQKKIISSSRIDSLKLIKSLIESRKDQVTRFISTSAIGYYGTYTSKQIFTEEDDPGTDFLAKTCTEWEQSIQDIADIGISTSWFRTGVVLSNKGGALKAIQDSMRIGLAIPLGSGNQWVPWIHIRDLIRIFEFMLVNDHLEGVYNVVSPSQDTNRDLTKAIAQIKSKKFISIGLPGFILKMVLGEMASISLYGSRVSPEKIQKAGYHFQFSNLEIALKSFEQERLGGKPFGFSPGS